MPLIQIRRRTSKFGGHFCKEIGKALPAVAAAALTCEEGGKLDPHDVMIEFDDMGDADVNCKDIHVRVWAHDYVARRRDLDVIRKTISDEVIKHLPEGVSWYVWLLLAPTSYGSDTGDK